MKKSLNHKPSQTSNKFKDPLLIIFGIFIGSFMTMMYFSNSSQKKSIVTAEKPVQSYIIIADQRSIIPNALKTGTLHYVEAITHATLLLHECNEEIIRMGSMQIADSTSFQKSKIEFYGISMPFEEVLLIKLKLVLQIHDYVIARNVENYSEGVFEQRIKAQRLHLETLGGNFQKIKIAYDDIKILHDEFLAQLN